MISTMLSVWLPGRTAACPHAVQRINLSNEGLHMQGELCHPISMLFMVGVHCLLQHVPLHHRPLQQPMAGDSGVCRNTCVPVFQHPHSVSACCAPLLIMQASHTTKPIPTKKPCWGCCPAPTPTHEPCAGKRPLNSALEIDVDFERAMRPPPQPTQESLEQLEDMIRKRIADHDYDDPPMLVPPEPVQPKPLVELDDRRSAKVRRWNPG